MKEWTVEEIRKFIAENDSVLYSSLKELYKCQTADERQSHETREHNNIGFNGVDAPILTSFAEFLKERGYLTAKQKEIARKKLVKYAKQITKLANAHEERKAAYSANENL